MQEDSKLERVTAWIRAVGDEASPSEADRAVLESQLGDATDQELQTVLSRFFDSLPVVRAVMNVAGERRLRTSRSLGEAVAHALVFHGIDDEAEEIMRHLP